MVRLALPARLVEVQAFQKSFGYWSKFKSPGAQILGSKFDILTHSSVYNLLILTQYDLTLSLIHLSKSFKIPRNSMNSLPNKHFIFHPENLFPSSSHPGAFQKNGDPQKHLNMIPTATTMVNPQLQPLSLLGTGLPQLLRWPLRRPPPPTLPRRSPRCATSRMGAPLEAGGLIQHMVT